MFDFSFSIPTDINYGVGAEKKTGELMAPYASKVMMVYGSERIFKTGLGNTIEDSLKNAGLEVLRFGGVTPNADTDFINEACKFARENEVDGMVAIGGGSVIDTAKAISAGAYYTKGDIVDLYTNPAAAPEKFLPIGAVVTIPGTASESNPMSVISITGSGQKILRPFNEVKPKFAILDPALTTSVSPFQTASGGFDMFAHAFERFFDLNRGSQVLDAMTIAIMKTIVKLLPQVLADPENVDLRGELMLASTIAHNDMLGPGGDFAAHTMSHEITKVFHVAHGAALALLFPAWCEHMYDFRANEEQKKRMEIFFSEVFGADGIEEGIVALKNFIKNIGLPLTVEGDDVDIEKIAIESLEGRSTIGDGFVAIDAREIEQIYNKFIR